MTSHSRSDSIKQSALKILTDRGPMNYKAYAIAADIAPRNAWSRFDLLHRSGDIHVVAWSRQERSGPPLPIYAAGPGNDADRPIPLTDKEKAQRHIDNLKTRDGGKGWKKHLKKKRKYHQHKISTDPIYHEKAKAWSRDHMRRKHGFKPRMPNVRKLDPLLAAIMGSR